VTSFLYADKGEIRLQDDEIAQVRTFLHRFEGLVGGITAETAMGTLRKRLDWLLRRLPTRQRRVTREFREEWKAWNLEMIAKHPTSVLAQINTAGLDLDILVDTTTEIIFTNVEITSAVLGWLLLHLSQHRTPRDWQDEVAQSLQHIDVRSLKALKENKLLTAVMSESMRVAPAVVLTIPELLSGKGDDMPEYLEVRSTCDLEHLPTWLSITHWQVPAGTAVSIDDVAIATHPAAWSDPASFDPGRFLVDAEPGPVPQVFQRFGLGARKCLGYAHWHCAD